MPSLRSREKFIPGGFRFVQPETGWTLPVNQSFQIGVQCIINHRLGNKWLTEKHGWSTDFETVANELDAYCCAICKAAGWDAYVQEGGPPPPIPKSFPSPQRRPSQVLHRLGNVAAGSETLVDWITSGAEAVPQSLADHRAEICAKCPMNGKGDFTRWFTVPVSNAILAAISSRSEMKLSTAQDGVLNVCEACSCPLKLKVHLPIERIAKTLDGEARTRLHRSCWIPTESQ